MVRRVDKMNETTIIMVFIIFIHFICILSYLAVFIPGHNKCLGKNENYRSFVGFTQLVVFIGIMLIAILSLSLIPLKRFLAQKVFNSFTICCIVITCIGICTKLGFILEGCCYQDEDFKDIFSREIIIPFAFMIVTCPFYIGLLYRVHTIKEEKLS